MINLAISAEAIFPNGEALATKIEPNLIWENRKPVGEDGIKVTVVKLPEFEKITVKISGAEAPITQEALEAENMAKRFVWVKFTGFKGRYYQNRETRDVGFTATATGITLCTKPQSAATV